MKIFGCAVFAVISSLAVANALRSSSAAASNGEDTVQNLSLDSIELADVMAQNADAVRSFRDLGVSVIAATVEQLNAKDSLYVIDGLRTSQDTPKRQAQLRIKRTQHGIDPAFAYTSYETELYRPSL